MTEDISGSEWELLKSQLMVGAVVEGVVLECKPFGVFVDIGSNKFKGLIQITDFKDFGVMSDAEYPVVGAPVKCVVLGYKEFGKQVWLGLKPSLVRKQTSHPPL